MKKCCLCLAPTALVGAIAAGIIAFAVFPSYIEKKVEKELVIKNGTEAWDMFVDSPVPFQFKIYFFNILNWENFNGDLSKLRYEEKGPYVYDQYLTKDVIAVSEDGNSLNYTLKKMFTFNPKLSGDNVASLDQVTVVNPGLGVSLPGIRELVKEFAFTETVEALAFTGTSKPLKITTISLFTHTGEIDRQKRANMYRTEEETVQVSTGKKDAKDILKILGFTDDHTDVWEDVNGTTCNVPRGTDGTQFHPNVKSDDKLWVYEPMICRSVSFRNTMDNIQVRGIQTLRFAIDDDNFLTKNPENKCYRYGDDEAQDDMLPLKRCGKSAGIDIVGSSVYFLNNPELRKKIGLKPPKPLNKENYGTYIDIEPITGKPLTGRKRLQLNLRIKTDKNHTLLKNLSSDWALIPLLWVEEGGDLDAENAQLLRDKIFTPKSLVTVGLITLMCVLIVLSVGAAAVYYFRYR